MATPIWTDHAFSNFATDYRDIAACAASPTNGPDGGPGVLSSDSLGSFTLELVADHSITPAGRDFRVEGSFDWSMLPTGDGGDVVFELFHTGTVLWHLEILDDGTAKISYQGSHGVPAAGGFYAIDPFVTLGGVHRVVVCGTLSSASGVYDGTISVRVDGTEVYSDDAAANASPSWTGINVFPVGHFGTLDVYDSACPAAPPSPSLPDPGADNSVPCCGRTTKAKKEGTGNAGPLRKIVSPAWTSQCDGGGSIFEGK